MNANLFPVSDLKIYKINGLVLINLHALKNQLDMLEIILFWFKIYILYFISMLTLLKITNLLNMETVEGNLRKY